MDKQFPSKDPLEGLRFAFKIDEVTSGSRPEHLWDGEFGVRTHVEFGKTPMTDPRSLGSSVLVHVLLILVASLAVLNVAVSHLAERPLTLQGDLEPVDNRVEKRESGNDTGTGGGGSPGEIGGLGSVQFLTSESEANLQSPMRKQAADALLSEILPARASKSTEVSRRSLPGPETTGMGLIPGSGKGGGGGSGGGSGGGVGRGTGPGTEFFGTREHGRSFAYVIDCSGSMATRNSLEVAKRELLASLDQLPADVRFSVVFYNLKVRVFKDPDGQQKLMFATTSNKMRVQNQLATIGPDGGTDHMLALRTALSLKPEVVFFLTDADLMTNNDVNEILNEVTATRIQAVEFGRGSDLGMETPLRRLATTTGGTYRYIDVTGFPRSPSGY
jgi:hypothetical protein